MLKGHYYEGKIEAGCDEAGRGCLTNPNFFHQISPSPRHEKEAPPMRGPTKNRFKRCSQ